MAAKDRTLQRLGTNVRKSREAKGLSQEVLAARSGLHRTYIGSVERGEYNVTILTLRKITKALGITVHDALKGII